MASEVSEFLAVCEKAVHAAGAELIRRRGRVQVREKGPSDLVTEADLAAQEVVRQVVLGRYPDHSLLGEEGLHNAPRAEYRWILDPLDGTTNYVHGIPFFSVSLALERDGDLLVGAILHPDGNECFTAAAGQGAWLNGQPIRTSTVTELPQAVAAVGFPYDVRHDSPDVLLFLEALTHCQSMHGPALLP